MSEIFYFSQHFAPIIDIIEKNTREARFGYVLKCMRETKLENFKKSLDGSDIEKDKFTQAWLARKLDISRGNAQISDWENGNGLPSVEQIETIKEALNLDSYDGNYLQNLAYGTLHIPDIRANDLEKIKSKFIVDYGNYSSIAYILDSYMNIIIANDFFYNFLEVLNNKNSHLKEQPLNAIELIFNPFTGIMTTVGKEQWLNLAPHLIWQLRYTTTDIRHTKKYMELMFRLQKELEIRFTDYWYTDYSQMVDFIHPIDNPLKISLHNNNFIVQSEGILSIGSFNSYRYVYYEPEEINQSRNLPIPIAPYKKPKKDEKILVFISYKHNLDNGTGNEDLAKRCIDFIKGGFNNPEDKEKVTVWSDLDIEISQEWHKEIQEKLNQAKVFVALVNHEYMNNSTYILEHELKPAIEMRKSQGMPIIPVILSPCEWYEHAIFKNIQGLPQKLTLAHYDKDNDVVLRDQFVKIIQAIREQIKKLRLS